MGFPTVGAYDFAKDDSDQMTPMRECGFYEQEKVRIRGAPPLRFVVVPWCAHPKHSPVTRERAQRFLEVHLKCGGELEICPIRDKFHDILEAERSREWLLSSSSARIEGVDPIPPGTTGR